MTIDNHPLTPKPVDDREAEVQVTQADRDLFRELERFVVQGYGGPLLDGEAIEVIARHREQAERGLVEALRPFANAAKENDDWHIGLEDNIPDDDDSIAMMIHYARGLTVGDLRAARKALDTRP